MDGIPSGGFRSRAGSKGEEEALATAGASGGSSSSAGGGGGRQATLPRINVACCCPPTPAFDSYFDLRRLSAYSLLEIPVEAARQLTLIEHQLYKAISAKDCLNRIWTGGKRPRATAAASPNASAATDRNTVTALIERFNVVSGWATSLILKEDQLDVRVSAVEALIEMASQCLKFRNFNGVMEIVSALGSSSVRRLTATWAAVRDESMVTFRELELLMSAADNFSLYRARVSKARPPAIPYFGIILRDLTLIHEGNKDYQARGLINTGKMVLMLNQLKEMERLQQSNYNFLIVPQVRTIPTGVLSSLPGIASGERSLLLLPTFPPPDSADPSQSLACVLADNCLSQQPRPGRG